LLPGAVRVTRGQMEYILPEDASAPINYEEGKIERSTLAMADAEVKKLRSELRSREKDLSESREECKKLKLQMESERAALDHERNDFRANSASEAAVLKEKARIAGQKEGYDKGYGEGLAKAESSVRSEYEGKFAGAVSLLEGIAVSLDQSREQLAKTHSPQLIRLWEMMLSKMLATMVEMDPKVIERVVSGLLKRISDRERIIVYLNPADMTMIEENKDTLMDSIRGVKFFELMSDDYVEKGSCLIETNLGIYDARWKTQLEQVSSEVKNLLLENEASEEPEAAE
jgi:flagellar assembly protein FliH